MQWYTADMAELEVLDARYTISRRHELGQPLRSATPSVVETSIRFLGQILHMVTCIDIAA